MAASMPRAPSHPGPERSGPTSAVSVIIAVRNGLPFVTEAVASALAQVGPDGAAVLDAVIVVDDGSTDGTLDELARIEDPRLTLMRNPGRGVSAARNAGIAASRSPWLLFLDADDRLVPDALSALLAEARPGLVAVYGDYERIDRDGHAFGRRRLLHRHRAKPSGDVLTALLAGNFLINGGVVICARDACLRANGFDPSLALCEDWHFWCRLAALGPFAHVRRRVMDYRVHQTSVMMHKQRRFSDFEPAFETIFADPLITGRIPGAALQDLRRRGQVSLLTYCAQQAVRSRAMDEACTLTLAAIGRRPGRAPWVMARVAGAMAGL